MPFPEPPDPCSQAAGASHGGSRVESDGCHGAAGATSSEGDGTRSRRQAARRRSTPKMLRWQFEALSVVAVMLSVVLTAVQSMDCIVAFEKTAPNVLSAFFLVHFVLGLFFMLEFVVRTATNNDPCLYVFSIWGIVDLLSGAEALGDIRCALTSQCLGFTTAAIWAMLRALRCIKLLRYLPEMDLLTAALVREFKGMLVLMLCMVVLAFVFGCLLYWAEDGHKGFESIPLAMWHAIVTMTTVGYGDSVPQTIVGRTVCAIFMLMGYSILAVPTIISILNMGGHDKSSIGAAPRAVPRLSAACGLRAHKAVGPCLAPSGPPLSLSGEAQSGASTAAEPPTVEPSSQLQVRRTLSPPDLEASIAGVERADSGASGSGATYHACFRPRAADRDDLGCLRPGAYQQLMEEAIAEFLGAIGAWTAHARSPSRPVVVQLSVALARPASRAASVAVDVDIDCLDVRSCSFRVTAREQEEVVATGWLKQIWLCAESHREVDMPNAAYQCLVARACTDDA